MASNRRLALLIDGDNAQASLLPQMLDAISKYGTLAIRRVYGDWSGSNIKSWKDVHHIHALDPRQQFSYTKGKNATDIGLIIDAMDILYTASVDGFCIVSSDSDYTGLVIRLRQQNLYVMGIGKRTTPKTFVDACDVFIFTDDLQEVVPDKRTEGSFKPSTSSQRLPKPPLVNNVIPKTLKKSLQAAYASASQEDGWAHLGNLGHFIYLSNPDFDPRTYGHKKLSLLIRAYPNFIEVRETLTVGGTEEIYIRLK